MEVNKVFILNFPVKKDRDKKRKVKGSKHVAKNSLGQGRGGTSTTNDPEVIS